MTQVLQVMIVEDSLDDAALMLRELRKAGFDPDWKQIQTAAELQGALLQRRWDLCIADYSLPSFGAPEALEIVRAVLPNLPFIVVSGTIGEETAVAMMRAGADDYFLKGSLGRLGASVESAMRHAAQLDLSQSRTTELELQKRVLEAAAAVKSEFIASMNHELRTPLNAILGFSKLLLEQLDVSLKHRRYLEHVYDAGGHLLALITDVLDLARLDASKMELRPEPVSLAGLLEPALAASGLAADEKGLTFESSQPERVMLRADLVRARAILNNLLSNAIKFTPAGGNVSLRARTEDGALLLDVADTGLGIAEALHPRVFGAFERLHEGAVAAPGSGLGLALTKQLVELHGGTITFDSAEGAGSTFHVRLPGVVTAVASTSPAPVEVAS